MRNARTFIFLITSLILSTSVYAGELSPDPTWSPDSSDSAMYTLEDVYNMARYRKAAPDKREGSHGVPPATAIDSDSPQTTGHTLTDVYEALLEHTGVPQVATEPYGLEAQPCVGAPWPIPRYTINVWGCDDSADDCEESNDTVLDNFTRLEWIRTAQYFYLGKAFQSIPVDPTVERNKIHNLELIRDVYNGDKEYDDYRNEEWVTLDEGTTDTPNREDSPGGYTDWRIPTPKEGITLHDLRWSFPARPDTVGTGQESDGDPFIIGSVPTASASEVSKDIYMSSIFSEKLEDEGHVYSFMYVMELATILNVDLIWIDYAQAMFVRNSLN